MPIFFPSLYSQALLPPTMPNPPLCELCSHGAALYCHADSAHLCWSCDAHVHSANFLVNRHLRTLLCPSCHSITHDLASASSPSSLCFTCSSHKLDTCSHEELSLSSGAPVSSSQEVSEENNGTEVPKYSYKRARIEDSSYESDTVSCSCSQSGSRKRKPAAQKSSFNQNKEMQVLVDTQLQAEAEVKLEAILYKWHKDLGMIETETVHLAMHLLERALQLLCHSSTKSKVTRVLLAVCLSLAARLCEAKLHISTSSQLERCTGVPQKLLQMGENQLCKLFGWVDMHEESADSSSP